VKIDKKAAGLVMALSLVLTGCAKPAENAETPKQNEKAEAGHSDAKGEAAEHAEGGEAAEGAGEGKEGAETKVTLKEEALEKAGIKTVVVGNQTMTAALSTTGEVAANPDREARVTPRMPGRVVKVLKSVGDRVQAGEPLALLESIELGQAQADYLEALSRERLAQRVLERQRRLFGKDLSAKKEVQAAENDVEVARINLEKAKNKLELFGLTARRLATLAGTRKLDPQIPLLAPIGGVVTAKNVTIGEVLQPEAAEPSFRLTDTSVLWVNASLYEKDLGRVREGQSAVVTTNAYGGATYSGRVTRISTALDPATRTAKARVVVANPNGRLKPEMFVSVKLNVGSRQALAIPAAAVLQEKGERFAFVQEGAGTFEKRPLELGDKAGNYFPVLSGIKAGDQVVVAGGFTLKSELLKESFGEEE
jgi:cobalt-zinc-cadmium efflux system membrane fusion protein